MVKAIYRVKIPDPEKESEYKVYEFRSPKTVSETLHIPVQTLYGIIKGTIKKKHKSLEHIKNIIIEKEVISLPKKKDGKKRQLIERPDFEKELIIQLENKIKT